MFENYPKIRPELPTEFLNIYDEHYQNNRTGNTAATSISMRLEAWMHRLVASDVKSKVGSKDTLEIGAGNLNHLPYEPIIANYDIVEPNLKAVDGSPNRHRIRNKFSDISEIPEGKRYHRITSIACFEHITDLPELIARSALLLHSEGEMRVAIPNEGSWCWKQGTKITGYEFNKKYGLDYQILMQYEHVNTADEIEAILTYFFKRVECRFLGISKKIAIYRYYRCRQPIIG